MTQEIPFPSPLELTVASALLLLSSPDQQPTPSHSSPQFDPDGELLLKSKSYSDEGAEHERELTSSLAKESLEDQPENHSAEAAARRRLNQFPRKPCQQRLDPACQAAQARSQRAKPVREREEADGVAREKPKRKTGGSTHIQRRADAILKLLSSGGCSSETRIRRFLGDSPDTSKALRMVNEEDEVLKRDESRDLAQERQRPYIYTVFMVPIAEY
ncbi:uncharacterized protein LOC116121025 [Pistacia vera]|uniref:uncharacterized protein LOC116121025 n=1 Tax=Pistacia vera TaxID=55513 RepID=UPI001263E2F7|nr:uncharacterized protein LOC116121025 [Pistacia vera]